MILYPAGRKKRNRPNITFMNRIRRMPREIGFMEHNLRYKEKQKQQIAGYIQMGTGSICFKDHYTYKYI